MPHVVIKLYSGKSERQKQALAQAVTKAVMSALNYGEESVSVGIEDVEDIIWDLEQAIAASQAMAAGA